MSKRTRLPKLSDFEPEKMNGYKRACIKIVGAFRFVRRARIIFHRNELPVPQRAQTLTDLKRRVRGMEILEFNGMLEQTDKK